MKCQNLFSGKNKIKKKNKENYFNMLSAENFTQSAKCCIQTKMYRLYRKMTSMYIFIWIQHGCLANMIFALDPSNSVTKRWWCIDDFLISSQKHCTEPLIFAFSSS